MPGRRPLAALLSLALLTCAPVSQAVDGPGYGGTADELSVVWEPVEAVPLAAGPARPGSPLVEDPNLLRAGGEGSRLVVRGVGFRARSEVSLRVGDGAGEELRVDASGTLEVQVPADEPGQARPGTSVIAVGRAPSGSARTLVGAVPPLPSGLGPADVVPWVAVAAAAVLLTVGRRRRSGGLEPVADPAHGPQEARLRS